MDTKKRSDELFYEALKFVVEARKASIALLQRKLKIGFARASRIIDELEEGGYISPENGSKPREVLINKLTKDLINKAEKEKLVSEQKEKERMENIEEWYIKETEKFKDFDPLIYFPWTDVAECIDKKVSTNRYRTADDFRNDPKNKYIKCPKCKKKLQDMDTIYFTSPEWTWRDLCGRTGWLVICSKCKKQVHFDLELMN